MQKKKKVKIEKLINKNRKPSPTPSSPNSKIQHPNKNQLKAISVKLGEQVSTTLLKTLTPKILTTKNTAELNDE